MNATEVQKALGISIEGVEVNPMEVAENHYFNRKRNWSDPNLHKDYRESALEHCLKSKVPFKSTSNSVYRIANEFIHISCPYCGEEMSISSGGGAGGNQTMNYSCQNNCTEVHLTIPDDGIGIMPIESVSKKKDKDTSKKSELREEKN